MKKTFPEKPNVPLSPLLLQPFHISREKKNINLHTPPPQQFKKKAKKSRCTLSPLHNEYNINPAPPGTVKNNLSKLQAIKKVTKNNKLYLFQ
jgi:hypothetical protein